MNRSLLAVIGASVLILSCSPPAPGQVQQPPVMAANWPHLNVPRLFVWGANKPISADSNDPYLTNVEYAWTLNYNCPAQFRTGWATADYAAQDVWERMNHAHHDPAGNLEESDLAPGKIVLSINPFGVDQALCDLEHIPCGDPPQDYPNDHHATPLRFAVDGYLPPGSTTPLSDRLDYLAGLTIDRDFFGLANYTSPADAVAGRLGAQSSRQYRHPFLMNAGWHPTGPVAWTRPYGTPLRDWFFDFVREWQRLQGRGPWGNPPGGGNPLNPHGSPATIRGYYNSQQNPTGLPDPDMLILDCEPLVAFASDINAATMLLAIYRSQFQTPGGTPPYTNELGLQNYWTQTLPGDPLGRTLEARYVADKATWGLADDMLNPNQGGLALGLPNGILHEQNRRYLLWWASIGKETINQVMKFSAFDVAKAAWPTCLVGNYDDAKYDSVNDTTGWFYDCMSGECAEVWPWTFDYETACGCGNPPAAADFSAGTRAPSNIFPRSAMINFQGPWMRRQPFTLPGGQLVDKPNLRWLAEAPKTATSDFDTPALYPLEDTYSRARFWQPNLYHPPRLIGGAGGVM